MAYIRKTVKYGSAVIVYYTGLLTLFGFLTRAFRSPADVIILMYHRVLDNADDERKYIQPGMVVSKKVFERQMAYLAGNYNPLSLEHFVRLVNNNHKIPSKSVVITFDDGWKDNYLHAFPILKKYNVPATIFLSTDYIDTGNAFWFLELGLILSRGLMPWSKLADIVERLGGEKGYSASNKGLSGKDVDSIKGDLDELIERLKGLDFQVVERIMEEVAKESELYLEARDNKSRMLSWNDVLEMSNNNIEFGSHGLSHRILTRLDRARVESEISESKRILESRIRKPISSFSYPNGNLTEEIKELVRNSGYLCAVATEIDRKSNQSIDLFELPRVNIHDGISVSPDGEFSRAMFKCHVVRKSIALKLK